MGHGVAVGTQWHQVRLGVYLSLVLGEWLDVVDLEVAGRVVLTVGLVEVEAADCACSTVYFYCQSSILRLPLVGDVCTNELAAFFARDRLFGRLPGGDLIYLFGR